ncbi:MAG: cobalamin-binding protein [Nitrospirota bacterium]|nr:cobalamin-binding protein [Nitrospirota bacterium]
MWALIAALLLSAGLAAAYETDDATMKRRQQGILTGMPFMANVAPRTFVDDLGRKIYLAQAPNRLVSLAPSITETLYAIGLADRVVGVTEFCDYPPEARNKPKVGYSHPNLETIVALQPDLVLAPRDFIRPDVLGKLEQLKIPTFVVEAKTVEDIASQIQMIGRMLGRSEAADTVAMELRRRLTELKRRTETLARPRVLYVLNSQPLITVGPGSFIHQLIEIAGGANVAARAASPYPRLSIEAVLKEDPQLIIFPVGASEGIPHGEQELWRRWKTMTAVKTDSFHHIASDLLNRPGPRIVLGLEKLAEIIHPEVFASSNPEPARP